jgi:hypothetical protein
MMIAEYPANCACVIASQVAGVATVTVNPDGTACASALDVPPFTLVDKISTDPDAAAAGPAAATAPVVAAAATLVTVTTTGTDDDPTPSTGASINAAIRRNPRRARRHRAALGPRPRLAWHRLARATRANAPARRARLSLPIPERPEKARGKAMIRPLKKARKNSDTRQDRARPIRPAQPAQPIRLAQITYMTVPKTGQ